MCKSSSESPYRSIVSSLVGKNIRISDKDSEVGYVQTEFFEGKRDDMSLSFVINDDVVAISGESLSFGRVEAVGMKKSIARRIFNEMLSFTEGLQCLEIWFEKR